jgi:pimeloyl-ACP methyl ester carboxylesterase
MEHDHLELRDGRRLAHVRTEGREPWVVFLGGFRSDMSGTKATHLEAWARARGRAFLRFDYTGHGGSSGRFEEGCIGDWAADAEAAIGRLTKGPVVLVGSSMGGWIALLVAARIGRVAGLVGIAAAPDFTEDLMWARFSEDQRRDLAARGRIEVPSAYSEEPDVITRRLIEDGRERLVLQAPLGVPFPVRLLHGTEDEDVPMAVALRLLEHGESPDMQLTLVKGEGHRFSTPDRLAQIVAAVEEVAALSAG